jgi:hypothetical protein
MMPPFDATAGVDRASGRWKDVLPDPIVRGLRVLPLLRHIDTPEPCLEIARMELFHLAEMLCQPAVGCRQHPTRSCTLALADRQLVGGKIDVFDP